MHVLSSLIPPYYVAAAVVHKDRIRRVIDIPFRLICLLFYDLCGIMADIVAGRRDRQPSFTGSISGQSLLVSGYLLCRDAPFYLRCVTSLLKGVLAAAHLPYIRHCASDSPGRHFHLIFTPRLEQHSLSGSPRLHQSVPYRPVRRFAKVSSGGVFIMHPACGKVYLYIRYRCSGQNAGMFFFFKMCHYEALPVERQLILRDHAGDYNAAAALSRLDY